MLRTTIITTFVASTGLVCHNAVAQSDIAEGNKFSWSENCGWMNWRDANGGQSGVRVGATALSGRIWGENIGWISVGDGTPTNGAVYSNGTGQDHGVNINANGELAGLAWGENVGWINFGVHASLPVGQRARFDRGARRFRGYAWGENIGWVNLDDATRYVGQRCPADFDDGSGTGTTDGGVNLEDLLYYLGVYDAGLIAADVDDGSGEGRTDGGVGIEDLLYFLSRYDAGC